ncbi:MAG: TrkA C-terminal domain-containing protein, partial [Gemmatimonadota bacterium]
TGVGVGLLVVAAVAAFASTGNAGILAASRYPLAMARDHLLPPGLGRLGRFQTPTLSIALTSVLIVALILLLDIEGIAKLASAFQLLLFSLLNLAVIIMRESGIAGYDPGYRSPFYPWMQLVGFLASFWLIAQMGEIAMLFTLGLIAVTTSWYFRYASHRVKRTGAIFHTFARLGERRHGGLDLELRDIVREKGLREADPFDEVVARAPVLEIPGRTSFGEMVRMAVSELQVVTGLPAEVMEEGFLREMEAGFTPVARGAALPHLRVVGLPHPTMLLARCREGSDHPDGPWAGHKGEMEEIRALFFLVSPQDEPGQHLRLLGHLATQIDDPGFLSRWLSATGEQELKATLLRAERSLVIRVSDHLVTESWAGNPLRMIGLPRGTLVAVVRRNGRTIVPNGSSIIESGDHLTIIGSPEGIGDLADRLGSGTG